MSDIVFTRTLINTLLHTYEDGFDCQHLVKTLLTGIESDTYCDLIDTIVLGDNIPEWFLKDHVGDGTLITLFAHYPETKDTVNRGLKYHDAETITFAMCEVIGAGEIANDDLIQDFQQYMDWKFLSESIDKLSPKMQELFKDKLNN